MPQIKYDRLPRTGDFEQENGTEVFYLSPKPVPTGMPAFSGQQLHQEAKGGSAHALVLPQPTPKRWKVYTPAFRSRPPHTARPDDVPYWQIEISEFKA